MPSADVLALTGLSQLARWNVGAPLGTPIVVTYSFGTAKASYDSGNRPGFVGFSETQKTYVRKALDAWAAASGVSFIETPNGQIRFGMYDETGLLNAVGEQSPGFANLPQYTTVSQNGVQRSTPLLNGIGGDVFLNAKLYAGKDAELAPGAHGYLVTLHEIGHALGFKHPFEATPTIDRQHDNWTYTVMSYTGSGSPVALGPVDVEAAQYYYGVTDRSYSFDAAKLILTQIGSASADWIWGTEITDVMFGNGGDDRLLGNFGDDILDGGLGDDRAVFSASRSAYILTDLGGGKLTVAGPDGADTLMNVERLEFSDQVVTAPGGGHGVGDFNKNGTSDLIWYNPTTRDTDVWLLNNGQWAGSVDIGVHPAGYSIAATGDFNRDGTADVLWYNSTTRDTDIWLLNNGKWAGSVTIGVHPAGSQVAGTGDFNKDGTTDVLWFNPSTMGAEVWLVNSGHWAGSIDIGRHPTGYEIAGIGDFNKDGTADVLWYNSTTRDTDIWLLNNGKWAGSTTIGIHPAGYQIAGTGDFNHDSTSDVLWFNPTTGDTDIWLVNNGKWAGSVTIGIHPGNYRVAGVGDFNRDGTSDVIWVDPATNDVDVWLVSNGHWAGSVSPGSHPDGWHVV